MRSHRMLPPHAPMPPRPAVCPPTPAHAPLPLLQLDGVAAATEAGDGASVFIQARVLLEMALEADPGLLRGGDKYDRLLDALAAEAEVGGWVGLRRFSCELDG